MPAPTRATALTIAIALGLGSSAWANDPRCTLSLDALTADVCAPTSVERSAALADLAGLTDAGAWSYWVVKFAAPPRMRDREALRTEHGIVLDYLPHHAWRVRLPAGKRPQQREGIVWIGAMAPAWKLGGGLPDLLLSDARPSAVPLTISLHPGADTDALRRRWTALEGVAHDFVVSGRTSDRIVLTIEGSRLPQLLAAIAPHAEVASVSLRKKMEYLNARGGWLHQSGTVDERPLFDKGIYGCGQTVGVLDSGVNFTQCAFNDSVLGPPPISDCATGSTCAPGTPDFLQRKTAIYYKWSGNADTLGDATCNPSSGAGHGTHVAGSITGASNAVDCETGTFTSTPGNLDGTAPGAKLIAQEMGESLQYVNDLGGSIYHAATTAYVNGVRVHSNSWGGSCCFLGLFCLPGCTASYDEFAQDADQAVWDHPDLFIAIAAGNNGTCCASAGGAVGSPGLAKSPLTVGASGAGAAGETAASFSSRGPTIDRRTKPDVMAQGNGIISTASNGSTTTTSCGVCTMSGTSMATPTAAGLAALVREYLNRGFHPTGTETAANAIAAPSAALIKALLINGARDMSGTGATAAAPNQVEGWGRIHLEDALYFDGDSRRLWFVDADEGIATDALESWTIEVASGEPLKVTLAWSDHPAALNANPHIVNRLRLEVVAPGGAVWTQKLADTGAANPTQSTTTSGYDERNVVHQIQIPAPEAGTYTIQVRGISVPMGEQGQTFAVVATGDLILETEALIDLSLVKTASATEVAADEAFSYELTASADIEGATGVVVTDTLPTELCVTAISAPDWICAKIEDTVTCAYPGPWSTAPGSIVIEALAPSTGGILVNTASVGAEQTDGNSINNAAEVSVTVTAVEDRVFADGFELPPSCL